MFQRMFLTHPKEAGETYLQHQKVALTLAFLLMSASIAALIHAFVPGLCVGTAGNLIRKLNLRLERR